MIFGKFMIRKTDILMEDGRPVAIGGDFNIRLGRQPDYCVWFGMVL